MQIVPRVVTSCMQISIDFIHVACNWQPRGYNLHATGGHSGTNYMRLAASRMRILHVLAASWVQSRQLFVSTLREQFFELKDDDTIKKSKNLRDTCTCLGLSINIIIIMHGPIQSRETVPLKRYCDEKFKGF
jgi:hypothetical protein